MKHQDKKVEQSVEHRIDKKVEHTVKHNVEHKSSIDKNTLDKNTLFGIAAILTIFLIVLVAIGSTSTSTVNENNLGQATQIISEEYAKGYPADTDAALCKIIAGLTTVYDDATLAVTLEEGSSTTYAGEAIGVTMINANGCVVSFGGVSDYLALGQIQRLGKVYITVKDVVK